MKTINYLSVHIKKKDLVRDIKPSKNYLAVQPSGPQGTVTEFP